MGIPLPIWLGGLEDTGVVDSSRKQPRHGVSIADLMMAAMKVGARCHCWYEAQVFSINFCSRRKH